MFGFLQRKQEQQQQTRAEAQKTYTRLVASLAKAGDLSDADGERLAEAANTLGLPLTGEVGSLQHHVELLGEQRRLAVSVGTLAKVDGETMDTAAKADAYLRETESMLAKLKAEREAKQAVLDATAADALRRYQAVKDDEARLTITRAKLADYEAIVQDGPDAIPAAVEGWRQSEKRIEADAQATYVGSPSTPKWRSALHSEAFHLGKQMKDEPVKA